MTETQEQYCVMRIGAACLAIQAALIPGSVASALAEGATPHCMARIIADVAAMEAPEEIKSKNNGAFGPVAVIKVNKSTGKMVYCAKNSYCYDSNAFEFTTPCRIKLDRDRSGQTFFVYFTR